jgi:hypothetical protein
MSNPSDRDLGLEARWFTGVEWSNGTAQRECVREFNEKTGKKPKEKKMSEPDWEGKCENCGESPIVPETGMCGPCTFGEADTVGGNW